MARAAVLGRLTWRPATLVSTVDETATARTLVLDVPGWPGHDAGQHVDVRLTAADGYTATRSYSIASAWAGDRPGARVEITVQAVEDGEVSPYLTQGLQVGEQVEVRGPVGGWFVWRPGMDTPVQLVAGGSGVVPLMAMLRARSLAGSRAPFRMLYSVRDPATVLYHAELDARGHASDGVEVTYAFTRQTPEGWPRPAGRLDRAGLAAATWPASLRPESYVCGPTGFVEAVADLLTASGHDPARIRTERFGPTGGTR
jgi:ferredoxin-NADP reductase